MPGIGCGAPLGRASAGWGWAVSLILALGTGDVRADPAPGAGALGPAQVAVVVNGAAPESVAVGHYYLKARGIPSRNLVTVDLPGQPHSLTPEAFARLRDEIDGQLDSGIDAVVFVWTAPWAVGCNALTAAYTLGYQAALCAHTCQPSQPSPYFDSRSTRPYRDFRLRLSMLLPADNPARARALIDRGVAADLSWPRGSAYFLITSDEARNSRARFFPPSGTLAARPVQVQTLHADRIEHKEDVLFYFTGGVSVAGLDTLRFLPGAIADHLTSAGGALLDSPQMSSLRWLDAGATGSYGTVSEPCNHWQKFPHPGVLLKHYLAGETLIEAYWKSVAWPGQGLFIGEPLASPYRRLPFRRNPFAP